MGVSPCAAAPYPSPLPRPSRLQPSPAQLVESTSRDRSTRPKPTERNQAAFRSQPVVDLLGPLADILVAHARTRLLFIINITRPRRRSPPLAAAAPDLAAAPSTTGAPRTAAGQPGMDSGSRVGLHIVLGDEKVLDDNKVLGDDNKVLGDGDMKVLDDNKVLAGVDKDIVDETDIGAFGVLSVGLQAPHPAVPAIGETVPPVPETERAVQLGALPPDALAPTTDDDNNKCPFFAVGLRSVRDSTDDPVKEDLPEQSEEDALLAERMRRSPFINWRAFAKLEKKNAEEKARRKAELDKWNSMSALEKEEAKEKEKEKEMELAELQARLDRDFEEGEGKTRWCMGA